MTRNRTIRQLVFSLIVLLSTLKWFFLASIAGVLVGLASAFFLLTLDAGINRVSQWNYYFLLIPVAFFLSVFLVMKFAPEAKGHGTEKVIEAIHKKSGDMNAKVIPVKLLATLITLISGGSAGKEGPCAQIGAGVASVFAKVTRMNAIDRKRFVLCGISAGFSAVFGTPIAGAIFAGEVIFVGRFSYREFLPSLIASYFSFFITRYFGVKHLIYEIDFLIGSELSLTFHMLILGIFIGIVAIVFITVLNIIEEGIAGVPISPYLKGIIGGLVLIGVVTASGSLDYIGLGTHVIDDALAGNSISPGSSFIKMFTTSVTLGSGGSGGILTPIFYIGSTAGNLWGQIVGKDLALFSAVGMTAFLAATTNTPLAAILLGIELFGVKAGSFGAIACAVSYLIVGHMSVYPSQVLSENKTFFSDSETNLEMGKVDRSDYVIHDPFLRKIIDRIKYYVDSRKNK